MNAPESEIQWFLARDGKQHGPVTDAEMAKLVELRHLKPTDLVWRAGFSDWRPASSVFPPLEAPAPGSQAPATPTPADTAPAAAPAPAPAPGNGAQAAAYGAASAARTNETPAEAPAPYVIRDEQAAAKGSWKRTVVMTALVLSAIGGGWLAFQYREPISRVAAALQTPSSDTSATAKQVPTIKAATGPSRVKPLSSEDTAASTALSVTDLDAELQGRPLWQAIKSDFPDWYASRVEAVAKMRVDGKPEDQVTRRLIEELVSLRRQNANHALAAGAAEHKALAAAFLANLDALSQQSGDACYQFISKGETAPPMLERLKSAEKRGVLENQVLAVVQAISSGKKSPVKHTPPSKKDYDLLAAELTRLGWSTADMQLFANPKELAKAPGGRVCNMLKDWFTAHLAITKSDVQQRLLFETLKPVVSG